MMNVKHLYFIALLTPSTHSEKITSIKIDFADKYNCKHALKLPPHITIQPPFRRPASIETEIHSTLQNFFSSFQPFEIKLNGFGSFNKGHSKVIFIRVEENKGLEEMHSRLMSCLRTGLNFSEGETPEVFHPHITLAHRDLLPGNFKQAWLEYKDKPFTGSFQTGSACLLKHNSQKWEVQEEFIFGKT
jgi:2'-5' RNA ligase